jgi:hypothetical protein
VHGLCSEAMSLEPLDPVVRVASTASMERN